MQRTRLIVNVDSDGVLYDMQTIFANRARAAYPENGLIDAEPADWAIETAWRMEPGAVRALFVRESKRGLFGHGHAYPGAIEFVHTLAEEHHVRIVTNKGPMGEAIEHAITDTVAFYGRHGLLQFVDLCFARSSHKQEFVADVVIDDHPGLGWAQPGAMNIMFDRPWNRNAFRGIAKWRDAETSVIRASSWDYVHALIDHQARVKGQTTT